MLRKITVVYIASFALFIMGCPNASLDPTVPTLESITDVLPVISNSGVFDGDVANSSRMLSDDSGVFSYYNFMFTSYCPSLTGFAPSNGSVGNGATYTQTFFNTVVTFTVARFTQGTNGIASGIRATGVSANNDVSIIVEFDHATKNFFYEQYFVIDDTAKNIQYPLLTPIEACASFNGAFYYTATGTYSANGSIVATTNSAAFMHFFGSLDYGDEGVNLQHFANGDMYAGPWNGTGYGAGIVLPTYYYPQDGFPDVHAIDSSITNPDQSTFFDEDNIINTVAYLKEVTRQGPPVPEQIVSIFRPDNTQITSFSVCDTHFGWWDELAVPVTMSEAKSRLPCTEWNSMTRIP